MLFWPPESFSESKYFYFLSSIENIHDIIYQWLNFNQAFIGGDPADFAIWNHRDREKQRQEEDSRIPMNQMLIQIERVLGP